MNTEHCSRISKNHSQQVILYSCIQFSKLLALTLDSNTVLHSHGTMQSRCTHAIHFHSAMITHILLCHMLSHLWAAESLAIHLLSCHEETPLLSAGCLLSRREETPSLSAGHLMSRCEKTPLLSAGCSLYRREKTPLLSTGHSLSRHEKTPSLYTVITLSPWGDSPWGDCRSSSERWSYIVLSHLSRLPHFQIMLSVSFSQRHEKVLMVCPFYSKTLA